MRSEQHGKRTSGAEVVNISKHGFWLLVRGRELFVSFNDFPWFREVPIAHVLRVKQPNPGHLYWPDLDVDLAVESIEHPERFPLISKVRPNNALQRAAATYGRRLGPAGSNARRR